MRQDGSRWIGLGFSENQRMAQTDAITAFVDSNDQLVLQDRQVEKKLFKIKTSEQLRII